MEAASGFRKELARKIRIAPLGKEAGNIAGVDVAYCDGASVAAAALYDLEKLVRLETAVAVADVRFPYIPGYLFFREAPLVLAALEKLNRRPEMLMVDGHGIAHPEKAGYASLLGALLDIPSIGCAKSRLVGDYDEPGGERGACSPLLYGGETVGAVVRTRKGTRPVFVSPGHLISLDEAVAIVLRCAPKFRIPEPLRTADALARKNCREIKSDG